MNPTELHYTPSWTTRLRPPLPWSECDTDDASMPPDGWKSIFDPMHKRYACHWLWKAQILRDSIKDEVFIKYQPADQKRLVDGWMRLHDQLKEYITTVSRSQKKKARNLASAIEISSLTFNDLKGRSDIRVKEKMQWAKKAKEESECFNAILSKQDVHARILVAGRTREDCNREYRKDALLAVAGWLEGCYRGSKPEKRVFWLHGERGCGKSVIAHYIAKVCYDQRALAAGYVFQDGFDKSKWGGLTGTFAGDFVTYLGIAFRASLVEKAQALTCSMEDFFKLAPIFQFELLTEAWNDLPVDERKPLLIVLDDLDRCDNWSVREICDLVRQSIAKKVDLPVYWIISSCDTTPIRDHLTKWENLAEHVVAFDLPLYDADSINGERDSTDGAPPETRGEAEANPDTPMPNQQFDIKTPIAHSFFRRSNQDAVEEAPDDIVEERVPVCSAKAALYLDDKCLEGSDTESEGDGKVWPHLIEEED